MIKKHKKITKKIFLILRFQKINGEVKNPAKDRMKQKNQ